MKLNSLEKKVETIEAEEILPVIDTRSYTFTINGLPESATHQDAVNAMIQNFHTDNKLDAQMVSDGQFTFRQLHSHIQNLTMNISRLENYLKELNKESE